MGRVSVGSPLAQATQAAASWAVPEPKFTTVVVAPIASHRIMCSSKP